jgi:hypothetical protein
MSRGNEFMSRGNEFMSRGNEFMSRGNFSNDLFLRQYAHESSVNGALMRLKKSMLEVYNQTCNMKSLLAF